MYHTYERYNEDGKVVHCPMHDLDGKITGQYVMGVKEWFDENPEERIKRGWVKHIKWDYKEVREKWPFNPQTHIIQCNPKWLDEWTVQDDYIIMPKSEEMLWFAEMASTMGLTFTTGYVEHDGNGGIVYGE